MKILVFSDSHGSDSAMEKALEMHAASCELALHAGDGAHSFMLLSKKYPTVAFRAVRGNCDTAFSPFTDERLPSEDIITIGGKRILLTHGNGLAVKLTKSMLTGRARAEGVDIAVFGHTHEAFEAYIPADENNERPIYLFNPGSAKDGRYGIIEILTGGILTSCASL